MDWIPLADLGDDELAIVARIMDVASGIDANQDDEDATAGVEGHQGDAKLLPWSVRASRAVYGDAAVWDP